MRFVCVVFALNLAYAQDLPKTWIDPDTGHRIVRLTTEPGSASLYFNQNGYTADGKQMVYTTPQGISALNLETKESHPVVKGKVRVVVTGHKTQNVYYIESGAVWSANVDTGVKQQIAKLPQRGGIDTVNADETLLAGTYIEGDAKTPPPGTPKGQMMEMRLASRLPMALFTVNIATGETKVIQRATDWLNHLEFSPTDPTLLTYCHEGPWHKVDRIWLMHADGSHVTKIHTRTMNMEIAGHEFWSADGKTIWYDLQTPRSEVFWLAGYNVETGERTQYHLTRDEWSIHFNVNRAGTLFCGDGGDPGQVAKATDGEWIYLFRPELTPERGTTPDKALITAGQFHAEKLVNMSKHKYHLEPNVSFSPDQKWVIFRSNMFGPSYAFAVEVAKVAVK